MNEDIAIPPIRKDGLQLEEHRQLQNRFWFIQRVSWVGFGVISIVALLGFTGSGGVFQKQSIRFAEGIVDAPRVSRWEGSDEMKVRFTAEDDMQEITIAQPFFDTFGLERIQPEPAEALAAAGGQILRFPTDGAAPHVIGFSIRAMHFGWSRFDLTIGSETKTVNILVLP